MLTRQLSTLVGAGLPIDESLAALSEQDDNERQRTLTVALRSRVMEGASLAQAMADFPDSFPEIFRATVAAGEQSGHLDEVLDKLADYAEARDALKQTLLAALTYPLLLTLVALAVVAGLLTWVVPQIIGVFQNMQQTLPLATRLLMGLSDFLRSWAWLLIGLLVLGLARSPARPASRNGALSLAQRAIATAADRPPDPCRQYCACGTHPGLARRRSRTPARCTGDRRPGRTQPADARIAAACRIQGPRRQQFCARVGREPPVSASRACA